MHALLRPRFFSACLYRRRAEHQLVRNRLRRLVFSVVMLSVIIMTRSIAPAALAGSETFPVTGERVPALSSLDSGLISILQRWQIPGAAVAIGRKGRIVYARGFGWADKERREPVKPESSFRVASISKSITAVAALKLIEENKLKLSDKAFDILSDYAPCCGEIKDPRLKQITVQDLLQCTAGWEGKQKEPLFGEELMQSAAACGVKPPPDLKTVIRYWMQKPLSFAPGSRYGYSNLAYAVLGEVVARSAQMPYEQYVQQSVLKPMALARTRAGGTLTTLPGEVHYYPAPGDKKSLNLVACDGSLADWPYGGDFIMEILTAPAGWISSAPDLVRMTCALAGDRPGGCLSKSSVERMLSRPPVETWLGKKGYFAMGWEVYETPSGKMFSRIGGMSGSVAYVVYRPDGFAWAAVFNSRSANQTAMVEETKRLVWQAIKGAGHWFESTLPGEFN